MLFVHAAHEPLKRTFSIATPPSHRVCARAIMVPGRMGT